MPRRRRRPRMQQRIDGGHIEYCVRGYHMFPERGFYGETVGLFTFTSAEQDAAALAAATAAWRTNAALREAVAAYMDAAGIEGDPFITRVCDGSGPREAREAVAEQISAATAARHNGGHGREGGKQNDTTNFNTARTTTSRAALGANTSRRVWRVHRRRALSAATMRARWVFL